MSPLLKVVINPKFPTQRLIAIHALTPLKIMHRIYLDSVRNTENIAPRLYFLNSLGIARAHGDLE